MLPPPPRLDGRKNPAAAVRIAGTVLCALCVAGMLGDWLLGWRGLLRQLLGAASAAFLLVAVAGETPRTSYRRWMLVALAFCWLGDILGPKSFLAGVAMFLLGHLAFLGAFVVAGLDRRWLVGGLAVAAVVGGVLASIVVPRVPEAQRLWIGAYSVVLAAMLGTAIGTMRAGSRGLVPAAAVLFFVSDVCLAERAFLGGGPIWTHLGYPVYYSACLLFAWAVNELPPASSAVPRPAQT